MEPQLILRQTNGILIYNEKKGVPVVPENYRAHPENPYMLLPILLSCSHREYKIKYIASCGCKHKKMYCNFYKTNVNTLRCMNCPNSDGQSAETGEKC